MTHTLHRTGSRESLQHDFVLLITPAIGRNENDAAERLRLALDVLVEAGPANLGFYAKGNLRSGIDLQQIRQELTDTSRLRCCFDDKSRLQQALKELKRLDLGLSVTVSGLIDEVLKVAGELELSPHTANLSLGVFGRVDRLPDGPVLDISTMCGHGMVGFDHVLHTAELLRSGSIDQEQAVDRLLRPCTCGIMNPGRTRSTLERICGRDGSS